VSWRQLSTRQDVESILVAEQNHVAFHILWGFVRVFEGISNRTLTNSSPTKHEPEFPRKLGIPGVAEDINGRGQAPLEIALVPAEAEYLCNEVRCIPALQGGDPAHVVRNRPLSGPCPDPLGRGMTEAHQYFI